MKNQFSPGRAALPRGLTLALAQARAIVARYRAEAPAGFDPQNITFSVTPGTILSPTTPWDYATFNLLGQPTVTATGTVVHADIAAGAVWATQLTPGANFYATSEHDVGIVSTTKYTLDWGANTPPTGLVDGLIICWSADVANTGTVSIDLGSGGGSGLEKALKKHKGQDLEPGDIRANSKVVCRYDSASTTWQMLSMLANRPLEYLPATGTDAYSITPSPAYALIGDLVGRRVAVKFTNANTGAATLNANTLGALAIKKNKDQDLVLGDIKAGQISEFILDDATPKVWQMQGQVGNPPAVLVTGADAGVSDAYVITTPSPNVTAYSTGMVVVFKANTTNTGAATLALGALSGKTIKKPAAAGITADLSDGDIRAGQWTVAIYDGTNFQLAAEPLRLKYLSATTALSVGANTVNFTHGLGASPTHISARIVCTSTELGYAVGDVIHLGGTYDDGVATYAVVSDATTLTFVCNQGWIVPRRDTAARAGAILTLSKWSLIITAWIA